MFINFKFFVLIVCFNNCCGASNLISTAIYSPPMRQHSNRHNAGQSISSSGHYYPVYSLPLGANPSPGELQYSSSVIQSTVEAPRDGNNMYKHQNSRYKTINSAKPSENQRSSYEKIDPRVRYVPNQQNQKETVPRTRLMPTHSKPMVNLNQRPLMPMVLKAHHSATTLTPMIQSSVQTNTNHRFLETTRKPNSTVVPRIQSIRFNWPKAKQNITLFPQMSTESLPQTKPHSKVQTYDLSSNQHNYEFSKRPFYEENKRHFRYEPTKSIEITDTPSMVTELLRETTPSLATQTVPPMTTYFTTEAPKEDVSDKRENMSPIDSQLNFQTQFYDSYKLPEDNYKSIEQNNHENSQYDSPVQNENTGIGTPENEVNYAHPNPHPEPYMDLEGPYSGVDPYEKDTFDEPIDKSTELRTPELRSLLEQFIQQLDLLKFVASKELQKSTGALSSYSSESNGKVVDQTVVEPSASKSDATYDEYQNERSFEQNLSNTETKAYKDTNEKSGRYGQTDKHYYSNDNYDKPPTYFASSVPNHGDPNHICSHKQSNHSNEKYISKPILLSTANSEQFFKYYSDPKPDLSDKNVEPIVSDITLSFD